MTTSAAAPPPQAGNNPANHVNALDGIRGLAILLVLIYHGEWFFRTFPTQWYFFPMHLGWSGVDLFFVLSGFLITGILIRTKTATNRASAFYMRRALRIFPLYYGVLLALFVGVHFSWWLRNEVPMHNWRGWLVYVLYLQNWAILHNPNFYLSHAVGHFWSLAVEEQFYLIWPWLVWALSTRSVLRLCMVGMAASLTLRVFLMWHFGPSNWAYATALTPSRGEGLLMGAALAAYSALAASIPKRTLEIMAAIGAAIILWMLAVNPNAFFSEDANIYRFTVGFTGFNLLCGALVGSTQYSVPYLTRALNWAWLRSLGKYSYGIYVYHVPVFTLSAHVLSRSGLPAATRTRYAIVLLFLNIVTSFTVAWLSFQFFESYFLRMKDRFHPQSEDIRTRDPGRRSRTDPITRTGTPVPATGQEPRFQCLLTPLPASKQKELRPTPKGWRG